mgnify:FL=1
MLNTINREEVAGISVEIHEQVADYLNNKKRRDIASFEEQGGVNISIISRTDVSPEHLIIRCTDSTGNEVKIMPENGSKSRK